MRGIRTLLRVDSRPTYLLLAISALFWPGAGRAGAAEGYVGRETCFECHDGMKESFALTAHGRAEMPDWAEAKGCESCHGPGEQHAQGGDKSLILSFRTGDVAERNDRCLSCHNAGAGRHWRGGGHDQAGLSCSSCHAVHQPWSREKALRPAVGNRWTAEAPTVKTEITESCLVCHADLRKSLFQRSNHPLANGSMSCVDCHSPHGTTTEAAIAANTVNDKCWECHAETRGPFLWEHAPVRDGCTTCHAPHGADQTGMLAFAAPRLCQTCHLVGHHQTEPGNPGKPWMVNNSCVNCHSRIHGSNHPSGILFMR
jgi:DmsE family decaheme c-type cytochrome